MSSAGEKTVSPRAVSILFLIVLALHVGLDEVMGLLKPTGAMLKAAKVGLLFVAVLFPLGTALKVLGLSARSALGLYSPSLKKASLAVVLGFVAAVVSQMILMRFVPPPQSLSAEMAELARYGSPLELSLFVLLAIVVAPVADELFFRGFVLRGLSVRSGPVVALIVSAALTGVFHWEPWMILYGTVMGLIFGGAVLWTGSVYTSIVLHALLNSLALLLRSG